MPRGLWRSSTWSPSNDCILPGTNFDVTVPCFPLTPCCETAPCFPLTPCCETGFHCVAWTGSEPLSSCPDSRPRYIKPGTKPGFPFLLFCLFLGSFLFYVFFLYGCALLVCLVLMECTKFPVTGVVDGCEPPCDCCKVNLGFL